MKKEMEVQVNTLTPELFLELYTSVGWEPPCIAQVKRALGNTLATFTAYDNGQAVWDGPEMFKMVSSE